MNVKIEDKAITFKISEPEMRSLLKGKSLENEIHLLTGALKIRINPEDDNRLDVDFFENALCLKVGKSTLKKLSEMGRSREGVSNDGNATKVSLQVDLRADTRRRPVHEK